MKIKLFLVIILASFLNMVFLGSCAKKEQIPAAIGYVVPLTGPAVAYTEVQKKAIDVALEEINSAGGVQGRKFVVLYEDSKMDPSVAVTAMKKLIDVDKVPVVLGFSSGEVLAMASLADKTKTVLLAPMASAAEITGSGKFVLRLSPSDAFQGQILADVVNGDKIKKAAVLYVNNDWGVGLKENFAKQFTKQGGSVIIMEPSNPEDKDFRTQLAKIKAGNPDALILFLHPQETIHAVRQIREMAIKSAIYGGDTFSFNAVYEQIPKLVNGIVFTLPAKMESPEFQAFSRTYEAKFKEKPDINAAVGYDGVKLIAQVMNKAGFSGDAIRQELVAVKGYRGASGEITFDEKGDVISKKFDVLIIRDGKYQPR